MINKNPKLTSPYAEKTPGQKELTRHEGGLHLDKVQQNPSDCLKSACKGTQMRDNDEGMDAPDKSFHTHPCKTPEYLDSYPPKRYFSSLEDNSDNLYNSAVYKNKKFKSGHLHQYREPDNKQIKLAKIDQILDDFVPAMRTTNIPTAFVGQLIDLHKRGSSNGLNVQASLFQPSKTKIVKTALKLHNIKWYVYARVAKNQFKAKTRGYNNS